MVIAVPAHQIAYMATPKVACTSVKAALAQIDPNAPAGLGASQPDEEQHRLLHQSYPTRRFRPHRWRKYEGWWRFTLVRDPLKRLLSVYSDRVVGRRELHNSPKMRAQSVLPMDPDPDFFFQHLDRYMAHSSAIKHHALPFRLFIGPAPLRYDRIFRVSEIDALAEELSRRGGREVKIPRLNKSSARLSPDDLRPVTLGFIREYLKEDYELLGDFYKCPL